ncbi:MAG: hypothetical protein ACLR07_09085 [Christensenellales bacterium]
MSYSSQTKEELCRFEPDSVCCLLAELSGIVCAAGSGHLPRRRREAALHRNGKQRRRPARVPAAARGF